MDPNTILSIHFWTLKTHENISTKSTDFDKNGKEKMHEKALKQRGQDFFWSVNQQCQDFFLATKQRGDDFFGSSKNQTSRPRFPINFDHPLSGINIYIFPKIYIIPTP